MILKDTVPCQIVSVFCAWNITTVEIKSSVHLLKSEIHQLPLFTSCHLGLVILVLVLRIWYCLHHWFPDLESDGKVTEYLCKVAE